MTLVIYLWMAAAVVTAATLLRVSAPYGRHARAGWGPSIAAPIGWVMMEAPSPLVMAALFGTSPRRGDLAAQLFVALWIGHYAYRAFVFPWLGSGKKAAVPVSIVASGAVFNLVNATLNGLWLFHDGPRRDTAWLGDPRFAAGSVLFLLGFWMHVRADAALRALRTPGSKGYTIPRGGLFEVVSCPNYLGEIVEWTGYAILTWSVAAASFALWTAANLMPRALAHHRWYRTTFADYPRERRAIVPGLL